MFDKILTSNYQKTTAKKDHNQSPKETPRTIPIEEDNPRWNVDEASKKELTASLLGSAPSAPTAPSIPTTESTPTQPQTEQPERSERLTQPSTPTPEIESLKQPAKEDRRNDNRENTEALPISDQQIDVWIKQCLQLAEAFSSERIIDSLTELSIRWQLPGFRLAFVGEFSRGKSTLINRLLDREFLPTGNRPTTGTLVSIVAGESDDMKVKTEHGWMTRELGTDAWEDLLATTTKSSQQTQLSHVRVMLNHPWLQCIDAEVIDTPGAGDLNTERMGLLCDVLSQCDAAIVLISATLPVSLAEATFIDQDITGKHISNTLVAVSKLDTVDPAEQSEILDVVRDRIATFSTRIPVLPIHTIHTDPDSDPNKDITDDSALAAIRTHIEKMVEKSSRKRWRSRKVISQLIDHLEHITELCQLKIDATLMSQTQKSAALEKIKQEKEETALIWEDIRLEINQRRLAQTKRFERRVMNAKAALLETYRFHLEEARDLKRWWERDVPFSLRRELLALSNTLGDEMIEQLTDDFNWMQTEVEQKFSRQIDQDTPESSTNVTLNLDLSRIQLTDTRQYRLFTRLAGTATTVCGYIFGGPTGAVISAVTWILSDQFVEKKRSEQRQMLSEALTTNLDRVAHEYCEQISDRLKRLYDQLIDEMNHEQSLWQTAWEESLNEDAQPEESEQYHQLRQQAITLKTNIESAAPALLQ